MSSKDDHRPQSPPPPHSLRHQYELRNKQQEEPHQLPQGDLGSKQRIRLSEDELVDQFLGRIVDGKQRVLKRVMRQSHIPFCQIIKSWMEDTSGSGDTTGLLRQRKARQVLDLIW